MMHAVRGIYRGGVVELLEKPSVSGDAEVVVTFLTAGDTPEPAEDEDITPGSIIEAATPLDDFEPILPVHPLRLSELVLEGRR